MCGIAGILRKTDRISPAQALHLAEDMANAMVYRGPDDHGTWLSPDGRVALAHRRLSIIDTSHGGHQPMLNHAGSSATVFNGELYNFRELAAELSGRGVQFRTRSDTEVLIASLEEWGPAALERFDAMFAFANYDVSERRLLLARDIFGEKPLYYVDTPDFFAFGSELHLLTLLPGFDASISTAAISSYLSFQYVPAPWTIYQSALKLLPGHYLTVDASLQVRSDRYFEFRTAAEKSGTRPLDDLADELEALLEETIRRRLISDVPLGAFLSGGVDSSTVAAIVRRKLGIPLQTYSIGFANHPDSEHFEAAETAKLLGTNHADQVLSTDVLSLGTHIGSVLDEPNADTSCLPTYLLCKFAREHVTVALSGDGGDELFGGYGRYFVTVDEWERWRGGDPALGWWNPGDVYLSSRILVFPDDVLQQLMNPVPTEAARLLSSMRTAITADSRPMLNVMRELDAATYLPGAVLAKVDRMSMQHSLEVRAPFLGTDVARFAMGLAADDCYANGQGKRVLKRVAERYLPKSWLDRPKRGFGLPMDMWGASTMLPALRDVVLSDDCRLVNWIPRKQLEAFVAAQQQDFHPYRTWSLFILEIWLRHHAGYSADALPDSAPASTRVTPQTPVEFGDHSARLAHADKISMLGEPALQHLNRLASRSQGPVLEIGPYVGGSTIAMADGAAAGVITVEIGGDNSSHDSLPTYDIVADLRQNLARCGLVDNVRVVVGHFRSAEVTAQVAAGLGGEKAGMLFVDTHPGTEVAIGLYAQFLADEAYLVVDDYQSEIAVEKADSVAQFVDAMVADGLVKRFGVDGWGTWFGQFLPGAVARLSGSLPAAALPCVHETGFSWHMYAGCEALSDDKSGNQSPLELLEDGKPLGPAHSMHDDVRKLGMGRYSHWDGKLWFSTSDNSSPLRNGRSYSIRIAGRTIALDKPQALP
ncbi:MAG: asparagine synthase (glutamine-hydrolyzing) [Gammaproteobacteria bacterium]|nr:asparagine synthase (glutamine-hydrolyzing) [Gammaproteobacteria bacterium]